MINIWMKIHVVSDKNHNIVILQCPIVLLQGMINDNSVGDTTRAVYN